MPQIRKSMSEKSRRKIVVTTTAIIPTADQRASKYPLSDPLLENPHDTTSNRDSKLACAESRRAAAPPLGADSAQRGDQHGLRGRTGGTSDSASSTRAPSAATRYLETSQGTISYSDLAPLLGVRVVVIEQDFDAKRYDDDPFDEYLIERIHRELCAGLVPQYAGWRRINVMVGGHEPPDFTQVRLTMREYALDLSARMAHLPEIQSEGSSFDQRLLETLAFAEGRLLCIHPFADFNGHTTRLFLLFVLRRLGLPSMDLVPPREHAAPYLLALAAADKGDLNPLIDIWRDRFVRLSLIADESA